MELSGGPPCLAFLKSKKACSLGGLGISLHCNASGKGSTSLDVFLEIAGIACI